MTSRASRRDAITLLATSAHPALADAIGGRLGVAPGRRVLERFADGELHVEVIDEVRGRDVYVVAPTGPPVAENLFEGALLADACRRAGAARLTAVVPYFGYARQDRRAAGREPVAARFVCDLLGVAGFDRVVAIDLHDAAIEGFCSIPLEHLTAVPVLHAAIRGATEPDSVLVAPDLGAAKLAERHARGLDLPVAVVHKTRVSGAEVRVRRITGDVRGRAPIVVDDMISTGGTIAAACEALAAAGAAPSITVVATHGLFVGPAVERLARLPIRRLVVTDTAPAPPTGALAVERVSVAPLLADAIDRLHREASLADLRARG